MKKINKSYKNKVFAGSGFFGMSNSNIFNLAMITNLVSSVITSATSMIAQDIHNNNPNPQTQASNFSWANSNIRFSPNLGRSSFSVLGGW